AGVYISLGDYAKAYDYLSEAMKLLGPSTSVPFRSPMTVNLGQTFLALARSCQWPEYYDEALKCFASYQNLQKRTGKTDVDLQVLNGIASISADQGRLDEARAALAPALEAVKRDRASAVSGMTMLNMAAISLAGGRTAEAERYFQEALDASKRSRDGLREFRASYGLGRCAELRGRDDQAVAFYNDAIRIIAGRGSAIANDAERAEFMSRASGPFQALIDLYFRLSQGGRLAIFEHEIFRTAESFRARSFLEQLERRSRQGDSAPPAPASPQEEGLAAERLALLERLTREARTLDRPTTADLQARVRRIDDILDAAAFEKQAHGGAMLASAPPVPLDVLQGTVLPERTALVEYVLGDERSLLICVTRNSFHVVELPSSRAIEDSLSGYLGFLEDPSVPPGKGFPAARRLYSELLEPALGRIPGDVDRLVIVPDGILYRLPFETLAVEGSGPSPAAYVNDRYAVSYAPSASSLFYVKRAPHGPYAKEALAFGVSEYGTPGRGPDTPDIVTAASVLDDLYRRNGFTIGPIPYAKAEVEGLARRLPPSAVDARFGAEATEASFKRLDLGAYRLIHLACHALSDERYPLRSSLVFSPSGEGEEDGFLEVSEMYRMRTNADLVVLSACQTGRGTIVRNEGALGLPRVLFYMGARSVISTLWPVHDKAGAVFMGFFYDSYFRGAGKAESLQAAKRKMAGSKYAHPYYWASYTLTGGL
ncbi:MAG TPA: CHAT domain-containing tetratricopeptide repeat protein, partial [Terriglobales bacterium]|nr:CHAT domain-containing tetratricopeptide repeat protein [Terriglobales bacterium]